MKAIILAAGMGNRMGKYTENLPKGMLHFAGKTLLERQIETLRDAGIADIIIISGYRKECIRFEGVRYYHNANFSSTNMVESLLCARKELDSDIIVAYSDILYDAGLVIKTIENPYDVAVAVDEEWRRYWKLRYGTTEADIETLTVSDDGRITELGKAVEISDGIRYRYIGLIKFSSKALRDVLNIYDRKKLSDEAWNQSGQPFFNGYMTDLINELILAGVEVRPVIVQNGWLEFDTSDDYEKALAMEKTGEISQFIDL